MKITEDQILNSNFTQVSLAKFQAIAEQIKYPYYSWNGLVYETGTNTDVGSFPELGLNLNHPSRNILNTNFNFIIKKDELKNAIKELKYPLIKTNVLETQSGKELHTIESSNIFSSNHKIWSSIDECANTAKKIGYELMLWNGELLVIATNESLGSAKNYNLKSDSFDVLHCNKICNIDQFSQLFKESGYPTYTWNGTVYGKDNNPVKDCYPSILEM